MAQLVNFAVSLSFVNGDINLSRQLHTGFQRCCGEMLNSDRVHQSLVPALGQLLARLTTWDAYQTLSQRRTKFRGIFILVGQKSYK